MAKPNILLLYSDQMRADVLACNGSRAGATPCLDELASQGCNFTSSYTNAPICVASRYSLITGRHLADHHWVTNGKLPGPVPELPTIMSVLGSNGYHTEGIGKMHFQPCGRHHGFHHRIFQEEIPDYRDNDDYLLYLQQQGLGNVREAHGVRNLLYYQPQVSVIPDEHHANTWIADQTIEKLDQYQDRPFFMWSSWIAPHPPFNPPENFADKFDTADIPLPHGLHRSDKELPITNIDKRYYANMENASEARIRRQRSLYHASVAHVDHNIGRVLDHLDRLNLAENTLVLFLSDHGEMLGDQGLWSKETCYEESIRVPTIIRFPKYLDAGINCGQFVNNMDIMPTILDAAQVDQSYLDLPGKSLLENKRGGMIEDRPEIYCELNSENWRWVCVRDRQWKYTYYYSDGYEELYNLENDLDESNNLAAITMDKKTQDIRDIRYEKIVQYELLNGLSDHVTINSDGKQDLKNFHKQIEHENRNTQFPKWVKNLKHEEFKTMQSIAEGVVGVTIFENTYSFDELDLDIWDSAGGDRDGLLNKMKEKDG